MARPLKALLQFTILFAALMQTPSLALAQLVKVDGGLVAGRNWKDSLLFRGIPFAAPPLGALRWKPPQAVPGWTGIRQSVDQPASCMQSDYGWNHGDFLIGSEDCLTLDVRTPAMTGKQPVLVWIHCGSNRAGGPSDIVLSDMGRSIVLVGVRYRLGIFGFLSHRDLTAKQGASGNYGLMDQIAALKWVQRNIARFGGDPANVTIAGESAGSQDVSLLLAAPAARPLFEKAIMESGTPGFGMPFRSLGDAERIGDQAAALLGTGGEIDKMRRVSAAALLRVDLKLHDDALESNDYMWLRITIDGFVLRRSPRQLLSLAPAKPVIIGTNRVELDLPGGRSHRDPFIAKAFEANEQRARSFYRLDEPGNAADPRLGTIDEQVATDVTFRCPAARLATILASKGAPVWRYEFDAAPGGGRTSHAVEISYAFGSATFDGLSLAPYWLNFIRDGDPNGPGLRRWPRFTAAAPQHLLFSDAGATRLGSLRSKICSMLDRI